MSVELVPLPEPLFLLHCGAVFGNERDDWETEANSGRAVDALADQHPGETLGLYDEHTVLALLTAERERCAKIVKDRDTSAHQGYIETAGDLLDALVEQIRRG